MPHHEQLVVAEGGLLHSQVTQAIMIPSSCSWVLMGKSHSLFMHHSAGLAQWPVHADTQAGGSLCMTVSTSKRNSLLSCLLGFRHLRLGVVDGALQHQDGFRHLLPAPPLLLPLPLRLHPM